MCYYYHGHPFQSKLLHYREYFPNQLGVKRGSWFIKKHYFWLHCKGTGNGTTLLLTPDS
jgi:hypothetical protein